VDLERLLGVENGVRVHLADEVEAGPEAEHVGEARQYDQPVAAFLPRVQETKDSRCRPPR
jgi:hypothetical protein